MKKTFYVANLAQRAGVTTNTFCAWCGKALPNTEGLPPGITSHGLCEKCRRKHFPTEEDDENTQT